MLLLLLLLLLIVILGAALVALGRGEDPLELQWLFLHQRGHAVRGNECVATTHLVYADCRVVKRWRLTWSGWDAIDVWGG